MKKLLFAIALVVAAVCSSVFAGDIADYVSADSAAVVRVDAAALLNHPEVMKAINSSEALAKQLEFSAKAGCNIKDLQEAVISVGMFGDGTLALRLSKKIVIADALKKFGDDFEQIKVDKYSIFVRDSRAAVCQFADDVVVFGSVEDLKKFVAAKRGIPEALKEFIPAKEKLAPVFAAYAVDGLKGNASCNFSGKDKKDLLIYAEFVFKKAKEAKQFVAMLPMYTGMISGMIFADAPELAEKVMQAFKVSVVGNKVIVTLNISAALADEIASMLNELGRNAAPVVPVPVK